MSNIYAGWSSMVRLDDTLPIPAKRAAEVLADHFRAHGGKATVSVRALIETAALLDENPIRLLVAHGWLTRSANGSGTKTPPTYRPTVPLTVAHLVPLAAAADEVGSGPKPDLAGTAH